MKMELIQPFINAADAVLAHNLKCITRVDDVSMEQDAYRPQGLAALVEITGDIEGRVVLDLDVQSARAAAEAMGDTEAPEETSLASEAVLELANQVIGNAVTALNDQGFRFKVHPPTLHNSECGLKGTEDTEALVLCFETAGGKAFLNIAMRYNRRRHGEAMAAVVE
jgi:chemotaxis protein CheX